MPNARSASRAGAPRCGSPACSTGAAGGVTSCRPVDHLWFADRWRAARGLAARPRAGEMDRWLHAERVDRRTRSQVTRPVVAGDLPDGAMVRHDGASALFCGGALLPWSFDGYGAPVPVGPRTRIELL